MLSLTCIGDVLDHSEMISSSASSSGSAAAALSFVLNYRSAIPIAMIGCGPGTVRAALTHIGPASLPATLILTGTSLLDTSELIAFLEVASARWPLPNESALSALLLTEKSQPRNFAQSLQLVVASEVDWRRVRDLLEYETSCSADSRLVTFLRTHVHAVILRGDDDEEDDGTEEAKSDSKIVVASVSRVKTCSILSDGSVSVSRTASAASSSIDILYSGTSVVSIASISEARRFDASHTFQRASKSIFTVLPLRSQTLLDKFRQFVSAFNATAADADLSAVFDNNGDDAAAIEHKPRFLIVGRGLEDAFFSSPIEGALLIGAANSSLEEHNPVISTIPIVVLTSTSSSSEAASSAFASFGISTARVAATTQPLAKTQPAPFSRSTLDASAFLLSSSSVGGGAPPPPAILASPDASLNASLANNQQQQQQQQQQNQQLNNANDASSAPLPDVSNILHGGASSAATTGNSSVNNSGVVLVDRRGSNSVEAIGNALNQIQPTTVPSSDVAAAAASRKHVQIVDVGTQTPERAREGSSSQPVVVVEAPAAIAASSRNNSRKGSPNRSSGSNTNNQNGSGHATAAANEAAPLPLWRQQLALDVPLKCATASRVFAFSNEEKGMPGKMIMLRCVRTVEQLKQRISDMCDIKPVGDLVVAATGKIVHSMKDLRQGDEIVAVLHGGLPFLRQDPPRLMRCYEQLVGSSSTTSAASLPARENDDDDA